MAKKSKETFHSLLVLNHWLLKFFSGGTFRHLQDRLKDPRLEGLSNQDGQSKYFHELLNWLINLDRLPESDLRRYDLNIVKYWNEITEQRNKLEDTVMNMKYFQYLSLLFTEIYLDWYFNHQEEMLAELNLELAEFNRQRKEPEQFQEYTLKDLNKIAFWNATGSGKTLLLHINIKQYLHYASKRPDKIILLTPNEGLSRQHLGELELSGIEGNFFNPEKQLFSKSRGIFVEIIDINKLGDEKGDKVVAVEAFEGSNLVLVDEGHRGTGSDAGAWLSRREALCADGFSLEYSATFGQAVAKAKTFNQLIHKAVNDKAKLLYNRGLREITPEEIEAVQLDAEEINKVRFSAVKEQYAKCILFDYSYKFFYGDGYGKESLILNLAADRKSDARHHYLTACLLSFYQQQYLWNTHTDIMAEFSIEKPLWIFVGNKVNDDNSDILEVLKFLARFLNNPDESIQNIAELKNDEARLLDGKGRNIFHDRFTSLSSTPEDGIFNDILQKLFNSSSQQRLKVIHLKNGNGELALKLGDNDSFGLINIGDAASFTKLCDDELSFDTESDDFAKSMFDEINNKDSKLNILIGSRKFTEGWSSWRVSTMGLLNLGRGEGSQIIQLFGRGVRLKGKNYSLQRSKAAERPKGAFLPLLETLNIFGVRADYMTQFKDYLREEGITPSDEILEVEFATQRNVGNGRLKTLQLRDGHKDNQKGGFKRSMNVDLYQIPEKFEGKIKQPHYQLDIYPKLQALNSQAIDSVDNLKNHDKKSVKLSPEYFCMMNFDHLYMELVEYKNQRSRYNLRLNKKVLQEFCCSDDSWYTLLAPQEDIMVHNYSDIKKLEEILLQLLQGYTDKFYDALKNAYEGQFMEYVTLDEENDSFIKVYNFEIENTDSGKIYQERLQELKQLVDSGNIGEVSKWSANHMVAICFDKHLYYPLMHIEEKNNVPLKMRPLAFDAPSEVNFVKDLENFYRSNAGKEFFKDRDLYLMRNSSSRNKGVGFTLAGNFYPDFLLWIVEGGTQYLSFIDPKGIRQVDLKDPKLELYKEIKTFEKKLGDDDIILNSFILTETRFDAIINNPFDDSAQLEERHVLFMDDGNKAYLEKMFSKIIKKNTNVVSEITLPSVKREIIDGDNYAIEFIANLLHKKGGKLNLDDLVTAYTLVWNHNIMRDNIPSELNAIQDKWENRFHQPPPSSSLVDILVNIARDRLISVDKDMNVSLNYEEMINGLPTDEWVQADADICLAITDNISELLRATIPELKLIIDEVRSQIAA